MFLLFCLKCLCYELFAKMFYEWVWPFYKPVVFVPWVCYSGFPFHDDLLRFSIECAISLAQKVHGKVFDKELTESYHHRR